MAWSPLALQSTGILGQTPLALGGGKGIENGLRDKVYYETSIDIGTINGFSFA